MIVTYLKVKCYKLQNERMSGAINYRLIFLGNPESFNE